MASPEYINRQKLQFAASIREFDLDEQERLVDSKKKRTRSLTPDKMVREVFRNVYKGLVEEPPRATRADFALVSLDDEPSCEDGMQIRAHNLFMGRLLTLIELGEEDIKALNVYDEANKNSSVVTVPFRPITPIPIYDAMMTQTVFRYNESDEVRKVVNRLNPSHVPLPPNGHPYAVRYDFEPISQP